LLIDEIVLVDLLALFLSVVTVSILWYVVKKIFPDDVKDLQSFLTFIVTVVPFVMIIYFGLAVINYDAMAGRSGWPPILPLSGHDRTYAGFNCTVDCSGHQAGYRWAEQHSIDDEDYCPDGDSESFYEGCIAYVRGMADQADNGIGMGTPINPDADDDDDSGLTARK
jgi:hypothetical protein